MGKGVACEDASDDGDAPPSPAPAPVDGSPASSEPQQQLAAAGA